MVGGVFSIQGAQSEDKNEDSKEVFDRLRNYLLKTPLHYNAKLGREDNFKQITGNTSLFEDSKNKGVGAVNFAKTKKKYINFQDHNFLASKYLSITGTSCDAKSTSRTDHILTHMGWHEA